jgi:hypothetical protein
LRSQPYYQENFLRKARRTLMKLTVSLIALTGFLVLSATTATAATHYVSQNGGGFSGGSACNGQSTMSVGASNGTTYGAGDVVYLCGVIGTSVNFNGSGSSGNPVTLKFDSGARISVPFCNTVCLTLGNSSWVVVDGGTACGPGSSCSVSETANRSGYPANITGMIEATAAGSPPLANQIQVTRGITSSGSNIEIKNLIIRNLYQHTTFSDTTGSSDDSTGWGVINCTGCSLHDSTMHDMACPFCKLAGPNGSFFNIYQNYFDRYNWGIGEGSDPNMTATDWYIHDNHFGSTANWDEANNNYHHNHIIIQNGSDSPGAVFTRFFIYNNLFDGQVGANNTGIIFWDHGPVTNTWVYNNVFNNYGNTNPVSNAVQQGSAGAGSSINVLNNTFIDAIGSNAAVQGCLIVQGTGQLIENNLFNYCQQFVYFQYGTGTSTIPRPKVMDYNLYGNSSNTSHVFTSDGNGFFPTLALWQKFTGLEAHSVYKSSGVGVNNDASLQSSSMAINSGANLSSLCAQDANLQALCFDTSAGGIRTPTQRPASGGWTIGAFNAGGSGGASGAPPPNRPAPPTNLGATIN